MQHDCRVKRKVWLDNYDCVALKLDKLDAHLDSL